MLPHHGCCGGGGMEAPRDHFTENYTVRACPTTPGGWHAISSTVEVYNNNNIIIISLWPITVVVVAAAAAAVGLSLPLCSTHSV